MIQKLNNSGSIYGLYNQISNLEKVPLKFQLKAWQRVRQPDLHG